MELLFNNSPMEDRLSTEIELIHKKKTSKLVQANGWELANDQTIRKWGKNVC